MEEIKLSDPHFKDVAIRVLNERFKVLGHKFDHDKVLMEYRSKSYYVSRIEYYDAKCLLCNYTVVMSIIDGKLDAFRIDDDKGLIAHKSGTLTNEYRICPRLSIME